MPPPGVETSLHRYLVELTPSAGEFQDVQAIASRARAAAEQLRSGGNDVRFLRSVFVPEDGSCFLLFEAATKRTVEEAVRLADLDAGAIAPAIDGDALTAAAPGDPP